MSFWVTDGTALGRKLNIATAILITTLYLPLGCTTAHDPGVGFGPERRNPNSIVTMRHSGLNFSLVVKERKDEASILLLTFPIQVESGSQPRLGKRNVKARVKLLDQKTVFEGVMESNRIAVVNAGWSTDSYLLSLANRVAIGHIHSVVVWIGSEEFEFAQF